MKKLEKQKQGLLYTLSIDIGSSELDIVMKLLAIQEKLTRKETREELRIKK